MDFVAICFYRESEDKEMANMTQKEDVNDRKAKHKNLTEVARLQAKLFSPRKQNCNKEHNVDNMKYSWEILEDIK